MKEITGRQAEILAMITRVVLAQGYAPSYREIAKEFGINHSTVRDHVHALQHKGFLVVTGKKARSIVLLRKGIYVPRNS